MLVFPFPAFHREEEKGHEALREFHVKGDVMTLNELRFIVAVAQERNFRRAAEKSFISQPALSLAIQKLEDELGLKIFERGRKEITVTPVGNAIVEQGEIS
jgi:hypothetical protein